MLPRSDSLPGTDESERRGGRTNNRLRPNRSYTTLRDVTPRAWRGLRATRATLGRVGMAEVLVKDGASLPGLVQAGRWASPAMPARYARGELAGQGAVARYYTAEPV